VSRRIDGARIGEIIQRAQNDEDLRIRLYYCPEKVVKTMNLTPEEAHAIRAGDLSIVDLDDATLDLGRKLFTELPDLGGRPPAEGAYNLYAADNRRREVCL
jgi:hypothetical protein